MKKILLFLLCSLISLCIYGQSDFDEVNINKAKSAVSMSFQHGCLPDNFLVCIFLNTYVMLIYEDGDSYITYYYKDNLNESSETEPLIFLGKESKRSKQQKKLSQIFNNPCTACCEKEVFLDPSFMRENNIKAAESTYAYFLLYTDGEKKCEFNLPFAYTDSNNMDMSNYKIPLNDDVFNFLYGKIMKKAGLVK